MEVPYLGFQKASVRVYHVPQEKMKWKDERERMCQWTASTRVYYQRRIKCANCVIICPYGFVCNGCNEGRKVITVNIPGAFLQGNRPKDEHLGYIIFKGIMVDMIYEFDQTYHE